MDIQTEVVEGTPFEIEGREFIPVAQRTSGIWRGATVHEGYSGQGGGFVQLRPTAIIERRDGAEYIVPIVDQTARSLWGMLAAAIVVPLLLMIAIKLTKHRK